MSFAQPWWLLLSLLCAVVLVLHIRRRRTVEVSSVELWRDLVSSQRPTRAWRPPRPSLPLFLQLLTVLLVALALARPQLAGAATPDVHRVVLLDRSGSMAAEAETGSRFDAALAWLDASLESREGGGGRLSLIAVGERPDVLGARLRDPADAAPLLAGLVGEPGGADWGGASALLPGLLTDDLPVEVVALTDGAGVEAARAALSARLPDADLEVLAFGEGRDNAGLGVVRILPVDLAKGRWRAEGTVRVAGEPPETLALEAWFSPGGVDDALSWKTVELEVEDGAADFQVNLEVPEPGLLELRLPDDALAGDNRFRVWLDAAPAPARVLVIGPDDAPLERALAAVPEVELFRADALPPDSAGYDLVVVDRTLVERHPGTHTLWLGGAVPPGASAAAALDPSAAISWNDHHPLSASVDWSVVEPGSGARSLPRLPGATVLLAAGEAPLVEARTTSAGREVVIGLDLTDTPWTEELGFPVLIGNLVRWAVPLAGEAVGLHCAAAEPCPLDPRLLRDGLALAPVGGGEAVALPSPFTARGDDPASRWAPADFREPLAPGRPGVYRYGGASAPEPGEPGEPAGGLLVVNLPAGAESAVDADAPEAAAGPEATPEDGWPAWRWLLLVALVLLAVEALAAGRSEGGFLRREALARDNPLHGRQRLVLALRAVTLSLAVLALVAVPWLLLTREQRLVLIVDDPDLYAQDARDLAGKALASAERGERGGRRRAVIELDAYPRLLADFGEGRVAPADPSDAPPGAPDGVDLAAALDLATALLVGGDDGRIALVSSGAQTRGDLASLLPELIERGLAVDVLPVGGVPAGEVFVERLTLPPRLAPGESFTLQASVYSASPTPAFVRLWRDGEPDEEREVTLDAGSNRLAFALTEESTGRHLYELEVTAEGDVVADNNRDGAIASVEGAARVAVVAAQDRWGGAMVDALATRGLEGTVLAPSDLPYGIEDLLGYDTVVLLNVPAIDIHPVQQETLEQWVRDFGGGLVLAGGENSFGPGGYYQTALERAAPLSSRVPQEAPKVALLFVLDRSGSMDQKTGGVSRLEIAKRAALDAVDLLHEDSLAGVLTFDELANVLVPLQSVRERDAMAAALARLQPGGGTALYPALESAHRQLAPIDSLVRHVVVLTDGLSQPGPFESVLQQITDADITVSTVSLGQGADAALLKRIARNGGGTFHSTPDARALPSILSQEAMMLSGTPVERDSFVPAWRDRSAVFLEGMPDALPPLTGRVRTTLKDEATLHLSGPEDDPVLASWRYGLGRVAAFASHGAGPWARDWMDDPFYPLLWSQLVRWSRPPLMEPGLHLTLERLGDEIEVVVEAVDRKGEPAQALRLVGEAIGPEGESRTLSLVPAAPGRYRTSFVADEAGTFRVRVSSTATAASVGALTDVEGEVYVGFPARFAFDTRGGERLRALADATGGRVLLGDEPLYAGAAATTWRWHEAWPLWAVLALAVLMLELILRYAPDLLTRRRA